MDSLPSTSARKRKLNEEEDTTVYRECELGKVMENWHSDDDEDVSLYMEVTLDEEKEEELSLLETKPSTLTLATDLSESSIHLPVSPGWEQERPQRDAIPFTGNPGLKIKLTGTTPLDYLSIFLSTSLLNLIVTESNNYAVDVLGQTFGDHSRITRWKDITIDELKTFIGLIFLMGIIRLNRINDYWKQDYLFRLSFKHFMSRDRFLLILRALHFSSNEDANDRLKKIRPLIEFFNSKMDEIYSPGRELSLDESMILWKGRLIFANKRQKHDMKLYVLTEPKGMVQKVHVYSGASDPDVGEAQHVTKFVHKLLEGKTGIGHSVFMDNYYNSVSLADSLLELKTYCTGILQANIVGNPKPVIESKLKKGQIVSLYNNKGVCVSKWKDKRDVLSISSEFSAELIEVQGKRGTITSKPRMIVEYNKHMKGADRQDQMLSYYPSSHKSLRWYKKLAFHLFQIMLVNSHFLHEKFSERTLDLHDFQLEICHSLLPDLNIPLIKQPPTVTGIHLPTSLPKGTNGKIKRKQCKQCYIKTKKRLDTMYTCSHCPDSPGLCIKPCFREYHNY